MPDQVTTEPLAYYIGVRDDIAHRLKSALPVQGMRFDYHHGADRVSLLLDGLTIQISAVDDGLKSVIVLDNGDELDELCYAIHGRTVTGTICRAHIHTTLEQARQHIKFAA